LAGISLADSCKKQNKCYQLPGQVTTPHTNTTLFPLWLDSPTGPRSPHYRDFTITLTHTKLDKTPLDEWSTRRDRYLTTYKTYKRETSMPPAGLEPTISSSEQPQTHAFDRAAIGIGMW